LNHSLTSNNYGGEKMLELSVGIIGAIRASKGGTG